MAADHFLTLQKSKSDLIWTAVSLDSLNIVKSASKLEDYKSNYLKQLAEHF